MANGVYTNSEIIDSLIVDLNSFLKEQISGQFLRSSLIAAQMAQKLTNLRETIDNDLKNRDQTIETLKEELRMAGHTVTDMTPEKFINHLNKESGDGNGNG